MQFGVVRPLVANTANLICSVLHPSERGAAHENLPACARIRDHCSSRRGVKAGAGCEYMREKVEVEVPAPTHQRPLLRHTPASHLAFSRMADPAGTPPFGSCPVAMPMRTRRPEAGTEQVLAVFLGIV